MAEGSDVEFTLTASVASDTDRTFQVVITGDDKNGTVGITKADDADFAADVVQTVVLLAGETTAKFSVTPVANDGTEGFQGFKVSLLDSGFNAVAASSTVVISDVTTDTEAPVVTAQTAPATYAENSAAGTVVATVAATDNEGVVGYTLTGNDAGFFAIDAAGNITLTEAGAAAGAASNDFETAPNSFTLGVVAIDEAGNESAAVNYVLNVTDVDDVAPQLIAATLSGTTLKLNFNEALQAGVLNASAFSVVDAANASISVNSVTISGSTVTLALAATPSGATKVSYTPPATGTVLEDAAGNDVAAIVGQTVGTDTTAPTLVSSSPADDAATVAAGANVTLTFSENVVLGTGNITLTNAADATDTRTIAVNDAAQVSVSGAVITINPTADLKAGAAYYVNVPATAVLDAAGNAFAGITGTTALNFTVATATPPVVPGQGFTLTVGENSGAAFTGGAADDTFNAPVVQGNAETLLDTLEGIDVLNGGLGTDTLSATINAGAAVTPTLTSVENVVLRVTKAAGAIDFAASTGVQSVTVQTSTAATGTIASLGAVSTLAVKNQNFDVTFDGSTAATLGLTLDTFGKNVDGAITPNTIDLGKATAAKATTLNVTANNAYAKIDSTKADAISTVTIAATGTNQISFVDSGAAIKSATITGAGSVDLTPTALTGALATFNASAAEGAIKADIQSTALATVTTGKGADVIDMDTAVVAGTTVNLGAGNDTLLTGALLGSFLKVDGGEGTDTINITNGAKLDATNAKLINNFEVLDVSGGTGNYDVSLNNFATVQIDEAVNGALTAAVDFKNAADNFTLTVASKAATNANFAVGKAITVTGKDYTGTTATGDAETFTLVANMRDGNKDDTADGNINANTITVAGVENLVVEANVSTLDGGSKALNAAQHTVTAEFLAAAAETITIKGAGSVNLAGAATTTIGVVTKVDATASTGNVTIDLSTHAKSVAYFGSEGVDTLITGTKGDNIYTGKGADIVTLTTAGVRDTFVLKAATDSQIGDTDKSGKITLAGDEADTNGVQQIDTITGFTAGGTATSDRLDVTNYAFTGTQRGVVDVSAIVTNATDLTSIADLFAAPAGDRGVAVSLIGGNTYVFIDANKDGNFTAADDSIIKLVAVGALGETDVNF